MDPGGRAPAIGGASLELLVQASLFICIVFPTFWPFPKPSSDAKACPTPPTAAQTIPVRLNRRLCGLAQNRSRRHGRRGGAEERSPIVACLAEAPARAARDRLEQHRRPLAR